MGNLVLLSDLAALAMKFVLLVLIIVGVSLVNSEDLKPQLVTKPVCYLLKKLLSQFDPLSPEELFRYIMEKWGDGGKSITLDQFTQMWNDLDMPGGSRLAARVFNFFDLDDSACISLREWVTVVNRLRKHCVATQLDID